MRPEFRWPRYYAAVVFDPGSNNMEAVFRGGYRGSEVRQGRSGIGATPAP
jgi:hypothetical protein